MIRKKILLLGDFNVGKTSLIRRYIDNTFDDKYLTTIGVKISKKFLPVGSLECELIIWDVEGATPQKRIPEQYLVGASGAIIVADCNREETMSSLEEHIKRFKAVNPDGKYVVAYNKSDLLTPQQLEHFHMVPEGVLTSAKKGEHVNQLFGTLAKEILL